MFSKLYLQMMVWWFSPALSELEKNVPLIQKLLNLFVSTIHHASVYFNGPYYVVTPHHGLTMQHTLYSLKEICYKNVNTVEIFW